MWGGGYSKYSSITILLRQVNQLKGTTVRPFEASLESCTTDVQIKEFTAVINNIVMDIVMDIAHPYGYIRTPTRYMNTITETQSKVSDTQCCNTQ